jgi:glutamyl-Q tRNA(Asp) synthetase
VGRDPIEFIDRARGFQREILKDTIGDFIVKRADASCAYQLAVVVDDEDQGITDVVRGADLLSSTARQIHLQQLLGYRRPRYWHVPVVTNAAGEKLSKQTGATPLDLGAAPALLLDALRFLGLSPPPDLRGAATPELWDWAKREFMPPARS